LPVAICAALVILLICLPALSGFFLGHQYDLLAAALPDSRLPQFVDVTDSTGIKFDHLSQNDLRIHFGLGSKERVDKVEILWPTGKTEVLTGLAADHFYDVKEGEGIVPAENNRPAPPK
jgi:hypothetical protein